MIEITTNISFLVTSLGLGTLASMPVMPANTTANALSAMKPQDTAVVAVANHEIIKPTETDAAEVRKLVRIYFRDNPILAEVAKCESDFRQYDEHGAVLRGRENGADVGVMQINEKYHLAESKRLGMDIYTIEGNLRYAQVLYNQMGTDPWSASAPCWSKALPKTTNAQVAKAK